MKLKRPKITGLYSSLSVSNDLSRTPDVTHIHNEGDNDDDALNALKLTVEPARKKLKSNPEGSRGYEKYDAERYTTMEQVPKHLKKYYAQRYRYFSLYDSGCLLDEEGWYSVTPELIAARIAERCRCDVVLDAFCGVGGNAIAFAMTCERVIALDNSEKRLEMARHNAHVYGVADRIEFVLADFVSFARQNIFSSPHRQGAASPIDVVFLSPPWGGPGYLHSDDEVEEGNGVYRLRSTLPIPGDELWRLSRKISPHVAFYLPRNVSLQDVGSLLNDDAPRLREGERVEVEEEWMGTKLKAVTGYFGGLAAGQEYMFDEPGVGNFIE